ncbi:unnamed protein product [Fusarium venenatum]|uniref:Xylanolytic transcriptional activator regulatory domain-containing protein n=1 Tax=Fusarium venenatum TaxID=56646 RepID=A0A2L2TA61_9HYPO|nr:uncharacterized protein FVRRES_03281 [Fusarium venenatum]KAH7003683.1 fungal-specific transcription factor domain-containing protein [Fusarium venenatum]CEI66769.1 unnamed protein product [Fusarium venenatum]
MQNGASKVSGDGSVENRPPSTEADSDEANQFHSEDEDHGDHETLCRNGKRKRPVSVSFNLLCLQLHKILSTLKLTLLYPDVKCDRGQPSCGWCSRNGAVCEYKERKKPGLRAGYGRELEQRLDKLEEILRSHAEIIHGSLVSNTNPVFATSIRRSNPSLSSEQGTPRDTHHNLFRPSEPIRTPQTDPALFVQKAHGSNFAPSTQSLDFSIAHTPKMNDGYHGQNRSSFSGAAAPSQLSPMQHNNATQEYYTSVQPNIHSPTAPLSSAPGASTPDRDMPPYDLLYALVDLYFKHINTWCPILHRKTTLDSLFGPSALDETDRVLLHAIVATTMRFSADARLTEERREHYHRVSKERVLLYGMENSSVKALQALVILALDLCGSSNGPPGWNIMALITRSVVQLGLAVEVTSSTVSPHYLSIYTLRAMTLSEPKDFIEEESRRRLFWMIYLLDRYATLATAFEFALDDKEIDRTLPCRDDLWIKNQKVDTRWFTTDLHSGSPGHDIDQPENLGAFAYYIEILGILSKIHKFLKQPVDISALSDVEQWQMRYKELDNMLTSWKFSLPGEFGNMAKLFHPGSKNINCAWVMLHATYHTAVIRLHSSAAYPTTRSPIFTPSYSASQRCHGAVENVAALGEFVVNNGMLAKLGPPFAFTLWVSARLLLVHGSTVERKLSPQLPFFVESLREMGRYWPVAARYSQLLQRVLDEHHDSERQGDGITPSSVKILSDMRRTAFDLDFLISRQPKQPGGSALSRLPSVTPARTPAPNELEYLDVFDFFNVPRLPFGGENISGVNSAPVPPGSDMDASNDSGTVLGASNEFNITNFMVDANSDWLFKQEGGPKYMAAT